MKKTFLYLQHQKSNAKFTEFNGWEMPIRYSSIIEEHNAVRNEVGIFDISHMGTFLITGKSAENFLNYVTVGNIFGLAENNARYSMFLNENGGVKDDIIVYKLVDSFMLVVNAGNLDKDWQWLNKHKPLDVEIRNLSYEISLLALQGPKALQIITQITATPVQDMRYFSISDIKFKGINASFCKIARTGYTGEDGFEIFISKAASEKLWVKLIELSARPCGLGCRDTLRLEAAMPLHGHEIDETINPFETGFQKTVKLDSIFIGKEKLVSIKDKPLRKLCAFKCLDAIARNSDEIFENNQKVGFITSGTFSPTLKQPICLGLIGANASVNKLEVKVRGTSRKLEFSTKPFYKRLK
ncbi:MAG: glycine cleavage system aminomethyltransferase GcvT [Elusimicrobiota bacterium]|jgi:aminomethyltransferase|nr:glycine cleavage system aminomethyltransferase GcvT [Elusimicrobiota bacterium]